MACGRIWFISFCIVNVLGFNAGRKLLDVAFMKQIKRIDSEIVIFHQCLFKGGFFHSISSRS